MCPLFRDFTHQENVVAQCLDDWGLRYVEQFQIGNYTVDFLVEDEIVIEADGPFGHLKKADSERDKEILANREVFVSRVIHIKERTKNAIKQELELLWAESAK
jgi:very-short-patch-repair endonuclease